MLKKIFDQFRPSTILLIPLTVIGALVAITWFVYSNSSHWASTRKSLTTNFTQRAWAEILGEESPEITQWNSILFTVFLLCLSYKILGLIPYTFSQTSHIRITFSLSIPIWIAFQILGLRTNWKVKLSHFLPQGTPIYLIPPMIIIETIRLRIQPITLGFRLAANILAGHLLIFLCSCTIWEAIRASTIGALSIILIIILLVLELAVACIQAAVFLTLCKNYLMEKV